MRSAGIALALTLAAIAACTGEVTDGGGDGGSAGTADGGSTGSGALSAAEQELLDIINAERTSRGLQAVALDQVLACAAAAHSADIGARSACTHTGADGSQPGDRVAACGGSSWSGEIVACGQTTPRAAVDGWLGSSGHREILLTPGQRRIGVAMHNNYWTALFDQ